MIPRLNPLRVPSTRIMREQRDKALIAIGQFKPFKWLIIHSVTLHYFKDCILVIGDYEQGRLSVQEGESNRKNFKVITKDGIIWKEYNDEFEPAEGFHAAFQYAPHDSAFPTKQW